MSEILTRTISGVAVAAVLTLTALAAPEARAQDRYDDRYEDERYEGSDRYSRPAGRRGGFRDRDDSGTYATIYGGAAFGNELEGTDQEDGFTGGLTLGLKTDLAGRGAVRTELDVNYVPVDDDFAFAESDLYNVLANIWYDVETRGPITPYVGGGVGFGVIDNDGFDNDVGLSYQVGGGVNFDLDERGNTFLGLGYRYYGFVTEVGNNDIEVNGHKVLANIGMRF